jgi:pimeloyl-ACP methyl ester carboxylesterase
VSPKPPIVYVRGFAGGTSGIDKQVDDPFYGFNAGSTHVRVDGDGDPRFYQFEGPLVRLVEDEGYHLLVAGDQYAYLQSVPDGSHLPTESIWVYRFYDSAASTFGARPVAFNLETAAVGLYDFVQLVRAKTGAAKVHLVAHSMGGLICRSMIEKVSLEEGRDPGRDIVDRFFTFGTPHGGISFEEGGGLLDWAMETFGPSGSDIFSPSKMYRYLTPAARSDRQPDENWRPYKVDEDAFDVERIFCLIGTDSSDYGMVQRVVGPKSDGLVMIDNAYVRGANRAFVHRSHSGRYGLVNSEEGYQNLRRFLFGALKVKVELNGIDLPDREGEIWQADVRLSVRGLPIVMHEQLAAHYCPVQLAMEEQRHKDTPDAPVPLATVFLLDPSRWHSEPWDSPPVRCRYALKLRIYSLEMKHGFFAWKDHLEQIADWEDTLIVDIGRADDQAVEGQHVWAGWMSEIKRGAASGETRQGSTPPDPITLEPSQVTDGTVDIPLPENARHILGERARLTGRISSEVPQVDG